MSTIRTIRTSTNMETAFGQMAEDMLRAPLFDRGEVHAQKVTKPEMVTRELRHITQYFSVPATQNAWSQVVKPNLPWAEDHFQERVCGEPLNPPPSHKHWPFNRKGNEEHLVEGKFSHTYPERFWPVFANVGGTTPEGRSTYVPRVGVRFGYGDLEDVIEILKKNPRSRQAYLPVWFPEDLNAARRGERVPCTLGYHFLLNPNGMLDCTYSMRSCDMVRFYRDDIYMAGRLLQWVSSEVNSELMPGELVVHIANLHTFDGDVPWLKGVLDRLDMDEQWGAGV